MSKFEVSNVLKGIRLIEAIPTSENTFTDEDLVELMSMELLTQVVPLIKAARAEFFCMSKDYEITDALRTINIPPEAVGLSVRDVMAVYPDGTLWVIPLLDLTELPNNRNGYIVRNNQIIIYHQGLPSNTIRVDYYTRPASLSLTEHGKVLTKQAVVDPGDLFATVTLDQKPASWQATPMINIVSKLVPFVTVDFNITIVPGAPTDTIITVPIDAFNKITVGDYLCSLDFAPVMQYVPVEAYELVKQLAAVRCLESLGDKDGWKVASSTVEKMTTSLLQMIMPRTETQHKKIQANGISNWR